MAVRHRHRQGEAGRHLIDPDIGLQGLRRHGHDLPFRRQGHRPARRQRHQRRAQAIRRRAVQIAQHHHRHMRVGVISQPGVEPLDGAVVADQGMAVRAGDPEAQGVFIAIGRGQGGQGGRAQQTAAEQTLFPFQQVAGRRIQGPGALRDTHVHIVRVDDAIRARGVAGSAAGKDGRVGVIAGVGHAQGLEQVGADEVGIGLAADLFDDGRQDDVTRVRIGPAGVRLEVERPVPEPGDQVRGRRRPRLLRLEILETGEVRDARGVGQKMAHRHLIPGRGRIRQIALHRRIQIHQPALVQQQDGDRRELFGERAQAEPGVARIGDVPFAIGQAIAPVQQDFAVPGDQHRSGKLIRLAGGADDLVHPRDVLRQGRADRDGQRHERRESQNAAATGASVGNHDVQQDKSPGRDHHAAGG